MAEPLGFPDPSDIASFQSEWSALLECASPTQDRQRLAALLRSADWVRLLSLAEEHGVTGHLTASLRNLEDIPIPPNIRQELADRQRTQSFFTLRLTAELFCVLERFSMEDINAVVIKGPVLAMRAYGDAAMRCYGDIDLLVRQRDIRRATELMTNAGFSPTVSLSAIDAGRIPGQYLFSKADSRLIIELHNDFTLRYFPRTLPLEEYFTRQVSVPLDAREVPALSVEDELVLICIHGAKHFWERLIWIADVAALVSRQTGIEWERVTESAKTVGAERMLNTGLLLASDVLRTQLPEKIRDRVRANVPAARLAREILTWLPAAGYAGLGLFERASFRARMCGGLIGGPAYLLKLSLSPTEEDWNKESSTGGQRFLDILRRPLRLARKYGRGNRS